MTELERDLRELGLALDLPEAPELAGRVRHAIRTAPARARLRVRRGVLAVAVALVAAAGALLAVPSTRGAILDFFGIGGVTVERVERLPAVDPHGDLSVGVPVSVAEARRRAAFDVLVPSRESLGAPDRVYFSSEFPGGVVSLLYGSERRVRALLTQFRGVLERDFVHKVVDPETTVEETAVGGERAYWIRGRHVVFFRDADGQFRESRSRLAANVLLWRRGDVTLRLEGKLSLARAVEFAESLR